MEELRKNGYAVFAAATISNTGDTEGPGMINQPISCGNVPVLPGDVILADDNGVTVVPQKWLDFVLEGCEKKQKADLHRAEEIRAGKLLLLEGKIARQAGRCRDVLPREAESGLLFAGNARTLDGNKPTRRNQT